MKCLFGFETCLIAESQLVSLVTTRNLPVVPGCSPLIPTPTITDVYYFLINIYLSKAI